MPDIDLVQKRRKRNAKDITYKDTVNFDGVPLRIQNKDEWGSYRSILLKIHERLKNLLTLHSKVLVMRYDFHTAHKNWEPDLYSHFLKASISRIKHKYQIKHVAYVSVREESKSGGHHYHLMLAINGNKVNYPITITNILTTEWNKRGQPHPRRNDHHLIQNTIDDSFQTTFFHMSYLAKIHTKDLQPANTRKVSASQSAKAKPIKLAG